MNLDSVNENGEYILQNSLSPDENPLSHKKIIIKKSDPYYASSAAVQYHLDNYTGKSEYIVGTQKIKLVNENVTTREYSMQTRRWYLLPLAYALKITKI